MKFTVDSLQFSVSSPFTVNNALDCELPIANLLQIGNSKLLISPERSF